MNAHLSKFPQLWRSSTLTSPAPSYTSCEPLRPAGPGTCNRTDTPLPEPPHPPPSLAPPRPRRPPPPLICSRPTVAQPVGNCCLRRRTGGRRREWVLWRRAWLCCILWDLWARLGRGQGLYHFCSGITLDCHSSLPLWPLYLLRCARICVVCVKYMHVCACMCICLYHRSGLFIVCFITMKMTVSCSVFRGAISED